jgi:hypothetical protein
MTIPRPKTEAAADPQPLLHPYPSQQPETSIGSCWVRPAGFSQRWELRTYDDNVDDR